MREALRSSLKRWAAMLAVCSLAAFLWWQNYGLQVTHTVVEAPIAEGMRMVQLSDLHSTFFGIGQERLAAAVRNQRPDVIVITGDFSDRRGDERASTVLLMELTKIAPVYCVTGNHEAAEKISGNASYDRFLQAFETSGARLLRGETVRLTDEISLTGADDVHFAGGLAKYDEYLNALGADAEGEYRLLLAHRPEFFDKYAAAGFDLTFSGHAHGGQIRLPLIGGLYAPAQGVLPRYTSGLYEQEDGVRLFVNRGLGNSVFPQRLGNRPEVSVIDIVPEGEW